MSATEPPFNPFRDADTPTELLGLLAGAASVCWSNPGGAHGSYLTTPHCANCLDHALAWRERAIRHMPAPIQLALAIGD